MKKYKIIFLLLFFVIGLKAQIKMPAIFSDNMVLQQQAEVNIWGKASVGEHIIISNSWSRSKVRVVADADGKWTASLKTPMCARNQTIQLKSKKGKVIIHNILIGEVWLCSGQSNMEFPIHKTVDWRTGILHEEEEMKDADYPEIHLFHVAHQLAPDAERDDCQGQWIVCKPENLLDFSAVGFVFGRKLYQSLHRPIGLIQSTWGGTHAESWTSMRVMKDDSLYTNVIAQYRPDNIKRNKDYCKIPSTLWNGMIYPILPFTIKGVIWYQGESNSERYAQYQHVFTNMISDWRLQFKQPELPFYFVQIAPQYHQPPGIREAQLNTWLSVPHTGMVVITDVGDSTAIHPRNKLVPGERLAAWALNEQYHQPIACAPPVYQSLRIEGDKAIVSFAHADNGLSSDGPLTGFFVAGLDQRFYPALAVISGNKVVVSSLQVSAPVAVRYGYANWFHVNLYNKEGIPASPFRTDRFIEPSYAQRFGDSEMRRFPKAWMLDHGNRLFWGYAQGVGCQAFLHLWKATGDKRYFNYVKSWADSLISDKGEIYKYDAQAFNLDFINSGKVLFDLYKETGNEKYHLAMLNLISQLIKQPRTSEGGFWHKKTYPEQIWLDGIYMASPFMAQFGENFHQSKWIDEAVKQITICHKHTFDASTGLYYHAWDESKSMPWADTATGHSPNFWGRSIGWYYMAMVDALDFIPQGVARDSIITWVRNLTASLVKYQDKNGLWCQIIDQPTRKGNYPEASVSAQCMYAMAKAANRGYVDSKYRERAEKAFNGITNKLVRENLDGTLTLTRCCSVAGLGGKPYRDGSFDYYVGEKIRENDAKATGPFIMGCIELNK